MLAHVVNMLVVPVMWLSWQRLSVQPRSGAQRHFVSRPSVEHGPSAGWPWRPAGWLWGEVVTLTMTPHHFRGQVMVAITRRGLCAGATVDLLEWIPVMNSK